MWVELVVNVMHIPFSRNFLAMKGTLRNQASEGMKIKCDMDVLNCHIYVRNGKLKLLPTMM
jgi:hypothetical protein